MKLELLDQPPAFSIFSIGRYFEAFEDDAARVLWALYMETSIPALCNRSRIQRAIVVLTTGLWGFTYETKSWFSEPRIRLVFEM